MKLINGLIERLALASTLFTVAFLALVSPADVRRMLIEDLRGIADQGFGTGHSPAPSSKGEFRAETEPETE